MYRFYYAGVTLFLKDDKHILGISVLKFYRIIYINQAVTGNQPSILQLKHNFKKWLLVQMTMWKKAESQTIYMSKLHRRRNHSLTTPTSFYCTRMDYY